MPRGHLEPRRFGNRPIRDRFELLHHRFADGHRLHAHSVRMPIFDERVKLVHLIYQGSDDGMSRESEQLLRLAHCCRICPEPDKQTKRQDGRPTGKAC